MIAFGGAVRLAKVFTFGFLVSFLLGCSGGGTTGTGGDGPIFSGRIVDTDGNPVSSAEVAIKLDNEVVASATTDEQGIFSMLAPQAVESVTLQVDVSGEKSSALVDAIAPTTVEVALTLKVEPNNSDAEIIYREDSDNLAHPTPTVAPTATPIPIKSTRFEGRINMLPRSLLINSTVAVNGSAAEPLDPITGTFDFGVKSTFEVVTAVIHVSDGREVALTIKDLDSVPGKLFFRVRINEVAGELQSELKFVKFTPGF